MSITLYTLLGALFFSVVARYGVTGVMPPPLKDAALDDDHVDTERAAIILSLVSVLWFIPVFVLAIFWSYYILYRALVCAGKWLLKCAQFCQRGL